MKVIVKHGRKWFWRIVASNGRTLAHSEQYYSKAGCMNTALKVARRMAVKVKVEE